MQTVALARKWRPKTFAELVGQQHVVEALTHALTQQRLHHAYLLSGTRGVGKTTLGRLFAKALNCEAGITPEPCGQCAACRAIDEGHFTDLIEIDAASRTKVEDTRELLDNVQFLPTEGRFKLYLIDEVHMLSASSFNALLKTLEEPPEHVKFILATTDPHKLPITVLSRCLKFNLLRIMPAQIAEHLAKIAAAEGIQASPEALQLLAYYADGSVRDALSLLDQAIAQGSGVVSEATVRTMLGLATEAQLEALLEALAEESGEQLAQAFEQLAHHGVDYTLLLKALVQQFHLIALLQLLGRAASDQDVRLAQQYVARFSPERIQLCYQTGLLGQQDLTIAPDARTAFEMTLLRMLAFAPVTAPGTSQPPPLPREKREKKAVLRTESAQQTQKNASLKKGGDPQEGEQNTPPVVSELDTRPLIEAPTREAALKGEEKLSRFAQIRAQLGGQLDKRKRPAMTEGVQKPVEQLDRAPEENKAVTSEVHEAVTWWSAQQWAEQVDALRLEGLVRELAQHCVVSQGEHGWLVAVAPEALHLQQQKGEDLIAKLGQARFVPWETQGETIAQWQMRCSAQQQAQARAAFLQDKQVQRMQQMFDAKIIESSIKAKES